jgi:transposase
MRSTSGADGGVVAADAPLALPGELERGGRCLRCERGGTCRSCGQRRRRAWRLVVVEGLSDREAGERMGLTLERVRLLVGQERDHRDLERFRLNFVATENVRAFVERELQRDPELTHAKLAEFIGMRQIDLERQLGYEPRRNGSFQSRIGVAAASRLMILLGRGPHELDGC